MYDYYDNDDSYEEQDDNVLEDSNSESQGYDNDESTNDDNDNVVETQGDSENVVTAQDSNDNVVEAQGNNDDVTTPHTSILGHQIPFIGEGFECICTGGCLCKVYEPKGIYDTDCRNCGHHLSDHTKKWG